MLTIRILYKGELPENEKMFIRENIKRVALDKTFRKRLYFEDLYAERGKGEFVTTENATCIEIEF